MNITEKIEKFLMTESYGKSYGKGKDESYDVLRDGKAILKKAMADVKKSLGVSGGKIFDGGRKYVFSEYDNFTLGFKETPSSSKKSPDYSVVVMTTDGDGEEWVSDSKSMLTAIKKKTG